MWLSTLSCLLCTLCILYLGAKHNETQCRQEEDFSRWFTGGRDAEEDNLESGVLHLLEDAQVRVSVVTQTKTLTSSLSTHSLQVIRDVSFENPVLHVTDPSHYCRENAGASGRKNSRNDRHTRRSRCAEDAACSASATSPRQPPCRRSTCDVSGRTCLTRSVASRCLMLTQCVPVSHV